MLIVYLTKCVLSKHLIVCALSLLKVLEGRAYPLQHPWVGIVNRSQADINKNMDMIAARRREREFFATSPDYGHLASRMGAEYLAIVLSKVLFLLTSMSDNIFCTSVFPSFYNNCWLLTCMYTMMTFLFIPFFIPISIYNYSYQESKFTCLT